MKAHPKRQFIRICIALTLGISLLNGCGSAKETLPELVKVTGIVTVQGKPATEVVVIFVSESDTQEVRGWTNPDGRFSLMYRNDAAGAVPGRYQVRFASGSADSNIIPEKYSASNSGIPVEITREGPNDFKFDL